MSQLNWSQGLRCQRFRPASPAQLNLGTWLNPALAATHAASESLAANHDAVEGALLLDVRRAGMYQQANQLIAGARWCDPWQVSQWSGELAVDRDVLVYCAYGHEVSRATALRLRATGIPARFLSGGIEGWKAAGRPLAVKAAE